MRALAIVILLGCGAKTSGDDGPAEAKDVGTTGVVVDAPRAWEVSGSGGSYRVGKGAATQVFVEEVAQAPATAAALYAAECARASSPGTREENPARKSMFVQCNVPGASGSGAGLVVVRGAAVVKVGERAIKCHFGTPRDPRALAEVCRSLRAK